MTDVLMNAPGNDDSFSGQSGRVYRAVSGQANVDREDVLPAMKLGWEVAGNAANTPKPGGSDTQVQYNSGGALAADSGFTYDAAHKSITLGGDATLGRKAAATWQLGAADAAAPVAQTVGAQSVAAGTANTAGVDTAINGSRGTGTGAGGKIVLKVAPPGSTGSAQNALVAALTINPDRTIGLPAFTVATLPDAGTPGLHACVTDGDASLAWGDTVINSGSGATKYLVWDNGTHWTVVGK